MWDVLIEALIGAVVAGAAAEVASKIFTGKWLHQHLYEWWRELSEQIDAWVKENEALGIARVVGFINRKLDHVIVGANRMVKLGFYAEDSQQRRHVVVEEVELSEEEVAAQFPELQQQKEAMVMEVSYADASQIQAPPVQGYATQNGQLQGVVAFYNNKPFAGECAYKLRWKMANGSWTDWQVARLKPTEAWYFWLPGAQVCQIDFDSVGGDQFWTSKVYDLELNFIPADRTAAIEDGRAYHFQWSGNNVDLFQGH
ncbi:MAG: hypothetical protein WCT04_09635 [Planctomycetota bacterium]